MFIQRSQRSLNSRQSLNHQEASLLSNADLELSRIPGMFYLAGVLLIGFSLYLISSASGSPNAIEGFNKGTWWQYLIAVLPLIFGLSFMMVNKIEKLEFHRKNDLILYKEYMLFSCCVKDQKRKLSGLTSITLLKKGVELKSFNNSCYAIQLTFEKEGTLQTLRSHSSINIKQEFQKVCALVSGISSKIKMRDMID